MKCLDTGVKRNEYLKRHVRNKHTVNSIFSNILDCVGMGYTVVVPATVTKFTIVETDLQSTPITTTAPTIVEPVLNFNYTSVDNFLYSLISTDAAYITPTLITTVEPEVH